MTPVSPLTVIHPEGRVDRARVIGSSAAPSLIAGLPVREGGAADLIVLAPSGSERRSRDWLGAALRACETLADDGLVVAFGLGRRLIAELRQTGLVTDLELLHLPDVARSRLVLPDRGPAARFVFRHLVSGNRWRRSAAQLVARSPVGWSARSSQILRRPGAQPLFKWLSAEGSPGQVVIERRMRRDEPLLLREFGAQEEPRAVCKVGGGALAETRALESLGEGAGRHSVAVPQVRSEGTLGPLPYVVESAVRGSPAHLRLLQQPERALGLFTSIAQWLRAWNGEAVVPREWTNEDAERLLLGPAGAVVGDLGEAGPDFLVELKRLSAACIGRTVPFVPGHNDLTAANVLVGDWERLAIVDWEHASGGCLPLMDLAYAAADLAAAVEGYRDRPRAYRTTFQGDGPYAKAVARAFDETVQDLGLEPPVAQLGLHACWLRHAATERAVTSPGEPRPFLEILRLHVESRAAGRA